MLTLHTIVHAMSMYPMMTMLILVTPCGYVTGGTSLLVLLEVSEFGTLFVGLDATLEADLVLIGEELGVVLSPSALPVQVENVEVLALALKLVQLVWDHWG